MTTTTLIKDPGLTVQVDESESGASANVTVHAPSYFAAVAEFEKTQQHLYRTAAHGNVQADPADRYRVDLAMFDPMSPDRPVPVPEGEHLEVVGAWLADHGTHPAVVHAFEQTGLTPDPVHLEDPESAQEWLTSILSWWQEEQAALTRC